MSDKERMVYQAEKNSSNMSPTTNTKEVMSKNDYLFPRTVIYSENEKENEDDDHCSSDTESSTKADDDDDHEEDCNDGNQEDRVRDEVQHPARSASHSNEPGAAADATPQLVEDLADLCLHDQCEAKVAENGYPATPEKSAEGIASAFSNTGTGHPALISPNMEDAKPAAAATMQAQAFGVTSSIPDDPTVVIEIEERDELSSLYVGRIIGKGGEMIRDLQARSGCRIDVHQDVEGDAPRIITYRGRRREDVDLAKELVHLLCTGGNENVQNKSESKDSQQGLGYPQSTRRQHVDLPLGRATMKRVLVPKLSIGKIIGRGGEMIRELQGRSGARIQIDHVGEHNATEENVVSDEQQDQYHEDNQHQYHGGRRQHQVPQVAVAITGTEESVALAEEMILFLSRNPGVDGHLMVKQHRSDWGHYGQGHGHRYHGHGHHGHGHHPQHGGHHHMSGAAAPYWTGFGGFGPGQNEAQLHLQNSMQASSSHSSIGVAAEGYLDSNSMIDFAQSSHSTASKQQQDQLLHSSSPWMNPSSPATMPPSALTAGGTATSMMIETDVVSCLKSDIGHIIGKKGVTINDLQQRTSTNIQIDQRSCQISLTGPRHGIEMAKDMLREIFERGPNHSFAGGRGFESHLHLSFPGIHAGGGTAAGGGLGVYAHHDLEPPASSSSELVEDHLAFDAAASDLHQQQQQPLQHFAFQYPHMMPTTTQLQQHPQEQQQYYEGDSHAALPAASSSYPWSMATTIDGKVYYYNQETMESTWVPPPDVVFDQV